MTDTTDLREFLENLNKLDRPHQLEAIHLEALKTGEELTIGRPWTITLNGITSSGHNWRKAVENWINAANELARPEVEADGNLTLYPPFGTPRNHAEEIGNACAAA